MKTSEPKKYPLAFLLLSVFFLSSLVWANLVNKEVPNDKPPGFTPNPIDSQPDDYKSLLTDVNRQIEETNQTKQALLQSLGNQNAELERIKTAGDELENKISSAQDSIDTETEASKTILKRVQQLSIQVTDKQSRLSGLLSMESTLASQLQDLEKRTTELNQEITGARETSQELQIIAGTPHTPGWYFTPSQGWLWSSPENYPMIYSDDREGWVFYERGSSSPWLCYDYTSQSWQAWDFE
jgi:peptidoglycan hydrolase CwlO-like protein